MCGGWMNRWIDGWLMDDEWMSVETVGTCHNTMWCLRADMWTPGSQLAVFGP